MKPVPLVSTVCSLPLNVSSCNLVAQGCGATTLRSCVDMTSQVQTVDTRYCYGHEIIIKIKIITPLGVAVVGEGRCEVFVVGVAGIDIIGVSLVVVVVVVLVL